VIRAYDAAGNVIERHEHKGISKNFKRDHVWDFEANKEPPRSEA